MHPHHRRSIRLPGADYAAGSYFVTICTHERQCVFGTITSEVINLNAWGMIVSECFQAIPTHFSQVTVDAFVVMPNHMHGIIVINGDNPALEDPRRGAVYRAPTTTPAPQRSFAPLPRRSLHIIVNTFKGAVTRQIHRLEGGEPFQWQRNYHEHIIRDQADENRIRGYIAANPQLWKQDSLWSED